MIPWRCPKFQNSATIKNITITNNQNSTLDLPFDALSIGHDLHINWICEALCTALWDPFFSHFPSGTFERHFITNAIYVHKLSIQLMYLHEGGGSGFSQPTHSTVEKYNFLFSPRFYKSNPRVDNAIAWYSTMGWQTKLQTACHVDSFIFHFSLTTIFFKKEIHKQSKLIFTIKLQARLVSSTSRLVAPPKNSKIEH